MSSSNYLLADQPTELERLQLQSLVWEPSGRRLLEKIGDGRGKRVLDVGCGAIGWLRVLSEWVGGDGEVVGTDFDEKMLAAAREFIASEGLSNVSLTKDDIFATSLEPSSFDLVHARFEVAPLGRGREQIDTYLELVRPGGTVVLEDPDMNALSYTPTAPALDEIVSLLRQGFLASGGDLDAGRAHLDLFRAVGIDASVRAEVQALEPGHPYLAVPLQMFVALRPRLEPLRETAELDDLKAKAEAELKEPGRWGTTFTLIQSWGHRPDAQ